VIADIGGGPGRYTDWLVEAGYKVIHRDLVAHHVDQVRARHGGQVDTAVGDARSLDLADESTDALLLLGPLYHLDDQTDRLGALGEARRVVRTGGLVHVAAISRWAPRLHGMLVDRVHVKYPVITEMIDEMERTGRMPPLHESSFTGYAHTPEELRDEVRRSGLVPESLVAIEGVAFALSDLDERMDDPHERTLLLDVLRAVESVPDLVGLGPHLLAIGRKH
jgi:SAM-dependent methyltransferase